ncbi:MAG: SET domain-containing protein-lysine N-methyltransferase [Rhizobiales bacterium]|nr:SET domain-containing protein-lysine N-methyltransferase [Hyphomicrobiales bacterium]
MARSRTGLGLFATRPIKKREYIVTYRGRRITNAEADKLEARGSRYMFEINSRWTIDGSPRWNLGRYVNHSCRPNTEAIERKGRVIVYIARRKIKPDEELTVDYGKDYFDSFITKSRCQCDKCRERRAARQAEYRAKLRRAEKRKASTRKHRAVKKKPTPAKRTTTKRTTVQRPPAKRTPTKRTPTKRTLAKGTPAKHTPAKRTSAKRKR